MNPVEIEAHGRQGVQKNRQAQGGPEVQPRVQQKMQQKLKAAWGRFGAGLGGRFWGRARFWPGLLLCVVMGAALLPEQAVGAVDALDAENTRYAADDLLGLYREARSKHAAYLAAQAGAAAEREAEAIALGQLLPSVSISATYGQATADRRIGGRGGLEERFEYDTYAYSLNLRQPIYRKYNLALYAQAQAQGEVAEARLGLAGNELVLRLAGDYLEALFADDQLRLLAARKKAALLQRVVAERNLVAGSGTRIDLDEIEARLDLIEAEEVALQDQRQHTRRVLGALVNREVMALARLDLARFKPDVADLGGIEGWLRLVESRNPRYQTLLAERRVAEQELEKAVSGHYPTLDFVASTGRSGNDSLSSLSQAGDTRYSTTSYGLQLNIPLVSGGQVSAAVRQARARLDQRFHEAEEARRSLLVQTRREYEGLVQGAARIRALERAGVSAERNVLSAQKGVQAGVRSTLDVLQAEEQLGLVRRDLAEARYAYLLAGLRLRGLAGELGEEEVLGLNRQFR